MRVEKGRVEEYQESAAIPLGTDVTVLGRPPVRSSGPNSEIPDIKINDDHVSRGHLRIHYSHDHACFVARERDAGTPNGTFINGDHVEPGKVYPLKDGDVLGLAKAADGFQVVLRFRMAEATLPTFAAVGQSATEGLVVDLKARRV